MSLICGVWNIFGKPFINCVIQFIKYINEIHKAGALHLGEKHHFDTSQSKYFCIANLQNFKTMHIFVHTFLR